MATPSPPALKASVSPTRERSNGVTRVKPRAAVEPAEPAIAPPPENRRVVLNRALFGVFVFMTVWGVYVLATGGCSKLEAVWWYGWITCASTGLGAAPFLFIDTLGTHWLGLCNALAAGMMAAASAGLLLESTHEHVEDLSQYPAVYRAGLGLLLGFVFILVSKRWLDEHEDLKFAGMSGASARKVLLLVAVMTLHSFSEGVGIGVSFGGRHGDTFGLFITATLAIHNIPEGLATSLVLIPRKITVLEAASWAIVTSLPQPLMAVPAYYFTQQMLVMLPVGLGFAAGAMGYVAVFELFMEAREQVSTFAAAGTSTAAAVAFWYLQTLVKSGI